MLRCDSSTGSAPSARYPSSPLKRASAAHGAAVRVSVRRPLACTRHILRAAAWARGNHSTVRRGPRRLRGIAWGTSVGLARTAHPTCDVGRAYEPTLLIVEDVDQGNEPPRLALPD